MVNVFLAYSSKDRDKVELVIKNLLSLPGNYKLWYYQQNNRTDNPIQKLKASDLFVILITDSSLSSPFVQEETEEAINLIKSGFLKGFCPIIYDDTIDLTIDKRVHQYIKASNPDHTDSPENAAQIIIKAIQNIE